MQLQSLTSVALTVQPVLAQFKKTHFASKVRSFACQWYSHGTPFTTTQFTALCAGIFRYADNLFVHTGCSNRKKLADKISKHNDSTSDLEAVAQRSAAKQTDETENVANKIDDHRKCDVLRNRDAVGHLIRAVLFCARHAIALRGHRETKTNKADNDSSNRGNFVELCHLLHLTNPDRIKKCKQAKNAQYTSKQAQDDFVNAAAMVIRREIVDDAGMYALIVDEARDNSCSELFAVRRYVSSVSGSVGRRDVSRFPCTD